MVNTSISGTEELEITVSDFHLTYKLLQELGFQEKAYQENKRASYLIGHTHIDIDSWPKIPPYLEIEGVTEIDVERVVELLGYSMPQTTAINTEECI